MPVLTKNDLLERDAYVAQRDEIRRRMIRERARRRVHVGDHCTVHFESLETLRYQVLEMLRAENSWDRPGAAEDELEAYAPLVPGDGTLSATLMFEFGDPDERNTTLRALVGVHHHVWLHVGEAGRTCAEFDTLGLDPDKVSSVQYLKWRLDDAQRAALRNDGTVVRVVIDHPAYEAQAVLAEDARKAIMLDAD